MNSPLSAATGAVAVFDSGLGGLTVLNALRAHLPQEDFFYYADTRFLPYGDKSVSFVRQRCINIARTMQDAGAKALVMACNTATALAAGEVRQAVSIPVIAIEPAVKPAAQLTKSGVIGVLATVRTLDSARFRALVARHAHGVRVIAQACAGLAETIEGHDDNKKKHIDQLLKKYLAPIIDAQADVVVLGCTHYPWIKTEIAARLPDQVKILDNGLAVARQLQHRLQHHGILKSGNELGQLTLTGSGSAQEISKRIEQLCGLILPVSKLSIPTHQN